MLESLQADLDQLGLDERDLPEDNPIKFKHLSEKIDLAKRKRQSVRLLAHTDEARVDKVPTKLMYGRAALVLPVLAGAEGVIVIQQAIQKCGGAGSLQDFTLFLVVNDGERKVITEKMIPFDMISQAGPDNCKLILEKATKAVRRFPKVSHSVHCFIPPFFLFFLLDSCINDNRSV